jgi:hypothetical protein
MELARVGFKMGLPKPDRERRSVNKLGGFPPTNLDLQET